ncbi:carboxypeptidase regulatory-like domain-containing protein [Brucepastera parasyntrophica]|uniref:carboxypeptidase regulatory-like domain-containing protein n=1 Tax=Brucepastera parasyntrophica TaxID=2880008 RepID=UPI00210CBD12|nr:carboxypeptidase regulatory-like domain-containing protein [Brucepastera parasyntrophica]ULQ59081.1 carboxypeptidase regulatory-like domain-containing protein [Brucepastera parasyntrophica]
MKRVFICILFVTAFFSFSCATNSRQKKLVPTLAGMIYDRENKPVNNADIYLDGEYSASSDIHGHFFIEGVKPGTAYQIMVLKQNYENIRLDNIVYTDDDTIIYINMFSSDQLIAEAERSIQTKEWYKTETFLKRAELASGDMLSIRYLGAVLAYQREQYDDALVTLLDLADQEKNMAYLFLFIADIYQYHKNEPAQAAVYLEKFLVIQYDADVYARLAELKVPDKG